MTALSRHSPYPLLLALLSLQTMAAAASEEGSSPAPPPPRIMDVRVWYYPAPQSRPRLVLWWENTAEQVDPTGRITSLTRRPRVYRPGTFARSGIFRVRVRIEGAMMKDGRPINWVSIVFRDSASNIFDLPLNLHEARPEMPAEAARAFARLAAGETLSEKEVAVIREFRSPTIKDIYWRVPYNFVSGSFDFQVGVWNDELPKTSLLTHLVDQTDFFILGEMEGP